MHNNLHCAKALRCMGGWGRTQPAQGGTCHGWRGRGRGRTRAKRALPGASSVKGAKRKSKRTPTGCKRFKGREGAHTSSPTMTPTGSRPRPKLPPTGAKP